MGDSGHDLVPLWNEEENSLVTGVIELRRALEAPREAEPDGFRQENVFQRRGDHSPDDDAD
jgi:hypothetical protein